MTTGRGRNWDGPRGRGEVELPESRNVEDVGEAGPVHIQELNAERTHRKSVYKVYKGIQTLNFIVCTPPP